MFCNLNLCVAAMTQTRVPMISQINKTIPNCNEILFFVKNNTDIISKLRCTQKYKHSLLLSGSTHTHVVVRTIPGGCGE